MTCRLSQTMLEFVTIEVVKMKEAKLIQKSINCMRRGKPFTIKSLSKVASYGNVRQVVSRLAKSGEIVRASRGIYVRPKTIPYLGKVLPNAKDIVKIISKQTGEVISTHGAEAANILHLSTQVPVRPIFYTSGTTRTIQAGKLTIMLKHVSPRKQIKPGTITCIVISALWYLGKEHVNSEVINSLKIHLSTEQFAEVMKHLNQMPAWMANAFNQYQEQTIND